MRPTLRSWLAEGPFSIGMSSGFFGFFAHAGFMSVVEDEGLAPVRLTGSSAGALVSGIWASGTSAKVIGETLLALRREDFWDPSIGFGLLRGELFRARLDALLGATTFEACRAKLAVSVYDVLSRRTRVIDKGALRPAIQASCTLPVLFQPLRHEGTWLLDGGIEDRPGLLGMPEGERVLFHHLEARSFWRKKGSSSIAIPRRQHLISLVLGELPRVSPFHLDEGRRAFAIAQERTRAALDRPIDDGVVRYPA